MNKIILGIISIASAAVLISCNNGVGTQSATSGEDSPTGAYKRLYAAVKAKNNDAIKGLMTKKSIEFAQMAAGQQNKPLEKVLENGFTGTTFSPELPQIRDERVNGEMGAVEVYNSRDKRWEDLPFVREDGQWKLAIGEMFAGTYKSPGKGQSEKEREAANAAGNNMIPMNVNGNVNMNAVKPIVPKPATNVK
jgi:hypothetical protein